MVSKVLADKGLNEREIEYVLYYDRRYCQNRIRKALRAPKDIALRLEAVFDVFADIKDEKTSKPLLNALAKKR